MIPKELTVCNVQKVSFRAAGVRKYTSDCYRHACALRPGNHRELPVVSSP
jgi:hypothetical protein